MSELKQEQIADQLLSGNFTKSGPAVMQLSDPLVDTPMLVTIDQLKPYELNPRIMKNPLYEEIKASIRERGLDAPPAITRRPEDTHYVIRNGGNTRLSILHELWKETKNERFYKIHCLFRPWQNEIVTLTGHLAENELHGQLTFIERSLSIVKLHELYEAETKVTLNQKQLVQKLCAEGYPISETLISRMRETVNYLFPAIPQLLYGGLSRTQIDRILRLRRLSKNIWLKYEPSISESVAYTFDDLFAELLSFFDEPTDEFDYIRFKDELTSRIADTLHLSYDKIELELSERESRQKLIEGPVTSFDLDETTLFGKTGHSTLKPEKVVEQEILDLPIPPAKEPTIRVTRKSLVDDETQRLQEQAVIEAHIVSPAQTTDRLDAIQSMLGELSGEETQNFKNNVIHAIPVQAGGLYPISDIWYINENLNDPRQIRIHVGQLVLEIAEEYGLGDYIETVDRGIGFECKNAPLINDNPKKVFLMKYLTSIAFPEEHIKLDSDLLNKMIFSGTAENETLSDGAFVKLMRIYRLLRHLWQL